VGDVAGPLAAIKRRYEALNRGDASAMSELAGEPATRDLELVLGSALDRGLL
jgi:hypothetical protein